MFFFFNDTATTEIYTLSLHDALPIWLRRNRSGEAAWQRRDRAHAREARRGKARSEEHTSELQSHLNIVCRLLLEKKKGTYRSAHRVSLASRYIVVRFHTTSIDLFA